MKNIISEEIVVRERISIIETNMKNIETKMNGVENSLRELNGKVDTFIRMISEGFVSQATFNEYKKARWLERILITLTTAMISGLVAFFLRENRI